MKKIMIEGIIGWDVYNKNIVEQLKDVDGEDIVVEIASPGGYISEGLKIYNTLKNYSARVDTHLVGSVASMATYIAMVGEHRTAEKNAVFMIHNGSSLAVGDHRTMFKVGKHLDSLTNMLAKEYSDKTGTPLVDIRSAMDDETFYYGDEIKDAGFVHEIVGSADPGDKNEAVACAELMFRQCQEKINKPEVVEQDMKALSVMFKQKKETVMTITMETLRKDAPDLLAQIQAESKLAGYDEGVKAGVSQERSRVTDLLTVEYADETAVLKAVNDGLSVNAAYKLFFEAEKGRKADELARLQQSTPDSVGQQGKQTCDDGTTKTFMAAVDEHQKQHGCTRTEALKAVAKANPELHAAFIKGGK